MTLRERIGTRRLAELYAAHADGTVRLAFLLTGDASLAEDLTQEAFIRLAGRFIHIRDAAGFRAYLRRTVINLSNSYFRSRRTERRYAEREAALARPSREETDVGEREALKQALFALPPRQRAVVVLRFYEDLSEAETADLLGCSVGTVKSSASRGVKALRAYLEGEGDV